MDISVVVPIYNVENYIERCLCSLFTQSKTDGVEFILVNDCTPDGSMAIARRVIAEFPDLDVKILEHPENRCNGAARQTGVEAAVGDYVIQIDSDDWCEPQMLEDMYAKAVETDADVVYCDWYDDDTRRNHSVCRDNVEFIHHMIYPELDININLTVTLWNKLVRRSLIVGNNINMDLGLRRRVDYIASIRIFYFANKLVYLSNAYYHYTHNNSLSIMNNLDKFGFRENGLFVSLLSEFMRDNGCDLFDADILRLSILYKITWIREKRGKRQRECLPYLPEVDEYVLKGSHFPMTTKIPYYLLIHGFAGLANVIFNLSDFYHKIKR